VEGVPLAPTYRFGRCELRLSERTLRVDGQPTQIGSRAFDLLAALIEHRDRVVTKKELLRLVWPGSVVTENNLHAQVSALRALLGTQAIATVSGRGYQFAVELQAASTPAAAERGAQASTTASIPSLSNRMAVGSSELGLRLAAILAADAVGYSRLMTDDDRATVAALDVAREAFRRAIESSQGRVVDMAGDSVLAIFETATGAVMAALAVQAEVNAAAEVAPEGRGMRFRIGVHLGDVIQKSDGTVYGDGVNIAARLEGLAEPGGITVSEAVRGAVRSKVDVAFNDQGEQAVKNISYPVRAYRVAASRTAQRTNAELHSAKLGPLRFGPVEFRPAERQLLVSGQAVALGARAFDLLLALVQLRGRLVTKNELLDIVWPGAVVEENNLQTQISTLRKVLGPKAIETIPGHGYRFAMALDGDGAPPADDPPPTSAAIASFTTLTNLAPVGEALFGRGEDLDAVSALVDEHRLITLLGTGGVGKSSLARALGRRHAGRYKDGIWWVDLASVARAEDIALAMANAANLPLGEGAPVPALLNALVPRQTLLLLDNCESWVDELAPLIQAALAGAPRLRFVATSQVPLKVSDEHLYRLDALAVPPPSAALTEARTYSALQLFEQRTRAVDRTFALTESNVAVAIRLCRRLDGIPLAIEMAAGRMALLGLDALDASLGNRLRLLKSSSSLVPARHQTLSATLDWSHSLLNADEQSVFRRLSVFAGSFRLDAAKRVAVSEHLDEWSVIDALAALVDKSLVQVERREPPRYRLLETARLYATEQLGAHSEDQEAQQQHGQAMAQVADEAERAYWTMADSSWLDKYASDYDDLRAAFDRACTDGDADVAAPALDALFTLDHLRAIISPLGPYLAAAAQLVGSAGQLASARLHLRMAAYFVPFALGISKLEAARHAVSDSRNLEDQRRLFEALLSLAVGHATAGDFDSAEQALADAAAIEDPRWPPRLHWLGANHRSRIELLRGDGYAYRECARAELPFAESAGSPCQAASVRVNLADAALMAGDWDEAILLGRSASEELRRLNLPQLLAVSLVNLCAALMHKGEMDLAREAALDALPSIWQHKMSGYLFCHLALLAASLLRHDVSARMLGYADAYFAASLLPREPSEARSTRMASKLLETTLTAAQLDALKRAGAGLTEEQAYSLAEGLLEQSGKHGATEKTNRSAA